MDSKDVLITDRCQKCITDRKMCDMCTENPKYQHIYRSYYSDYIPACPAGYTDCVYDPAYMKASNPGLYKESYGDVSPEDVVRNEGCGNVHLSPDGEDLLCDEYDDEDK